MNDIQVELARHALGLPNDRKTSYRNHFCTARDDKQWSAMVSQGDAVMRESILLDNDHVMFYLTHEGALAALTGDETLEEEDAVIMRRLSAKVASAKVA